MSPGRIGAVSNYTFESGERTGFAQKSDEATPGWMPAGIDFEGEAIDVSGLNPWAVGTKEWRGLNEWIVVPHPAYPNQRHVADVYEITAPEGRIVTFAAAELSNGVWGFFVPAGL